MTAGDAATAAGPDRTGDRRLPAIAAVVVLGLVLRLMHIRADLPDFLEEAIPFRRALDMWGWDRGVTDLNPHLFHYPSLTFYLHFLVQKAHYAWGALTGRFASPADYYLSFQIDPSSQAILARLPGVLADAVTIGCVARIGERLRRGAGIAAAAIVACSPLMIVTSRTIFADSIMTALALLSLERMLAYAAHGGRGRLVASAVFLGLATGAKYPAALLVVPLTWILWRRDGVSGLRRAAWAGLGALAAFLVTTPYAVLDFATFREDLGFVGALTEGGHLGGLGRPAFGFYAATLARDLGWPCIVAMVVSVPLLVARRAPPGTAALCLALAAFGAPIALSQVHAFRYLAPVIPLTALLGAIAALDVARRVPARWHGLAALAFVALLVAPSVSGGLADARHSSEDTQVAARRWCEAHLGPNDLILQEAHTVRLPTARETWAIESGRAFHAARPELQEKLRRRRVYRAALIPLVVSGHATAGVVPAGGGNPVEVAVFPHAVYLNGLFYDPRVLPGVDVVITSSAVRDRFTADPARFEYENDFYRMLDRVAPVAAEFRPGGATVGPVIRIHRLGPRAWSELRARDGPLMPFWWTDRIPAAYRLEATRLMTPGAPVPEGPADANGLPVPWIQSLEPLFQGRIATFASDLELQQTELGRYETSAAWAASLLAMSPDDVSACLLYVVSTRGLGRPMDARIMAERTIGAAIARGRQTRDDVDFLRITWAELLFRTGDPARGRAVLEDVIRQAGGAGENAARAREVLEGRTP